METFRVLVDVTFVLSVLNAAVTPTSLARQLHDERVAGEVKANT